MFARHSHHWLCAAFCFVLAGPVPVLGQGSPLTLGPLTVTVPAGWYAQTNVVPIRLFSPDSTPQQYFQVEFLPFEQTAQDVRERHSLAWARIAATIQAVSLPETGVSGQFIWTRVDAQRAPGQQDTLILYSAKSGAIYMPIAVDATRSDLLSRNLPALDAMLRTATFNDVPQSQASSASNSGAGKSAGPQTNVASPATLSEYAYTTPDGWTASQYSDGIVLMSPASVTNERCVVTLWPMRPAGADVIGDANRIFQDVYKNYEPRNQTTRGTPMPASMVRGTSGQGWDYVIVRRGIAPRGSPESRLGFVFVAKLNTLLAVISGVSKDPLVSTCFGELAYNAWPRFFYSLSFKNWTPTNQTSAMRERIVGVWTTATATVADQFIFAGNGRYASTAAAQQYSRISDSEALRTTQAFFGNGTYTLRGSAITLTPDDRSNPPETGFVRVEEESKDDARSWVQTLYLLRTSAVDGKEYEVRYQKRLGGFWPRENRLLWPISVLSERR